MYTCIYVYMYTCIHVYMHLREFIVLKSEILKSLCTQLIHKNIAESQEISAESRVETRYIYMYIGYFENF